MASTIHQSNSQAIVRSSTMDAPSQDYLANNDEIDIIVIHAIYNIQTKFTFSLVGAIELDGNINLFRFTDFLCKKKYMLDFDEDKEESRNFIFRKNLPNFNSPLLYDLNNYIQCFNFFIGWKRCHDILHIYIKPNQLGSELYLSLNEQNEPVVQLTPP